MENIHNNITEILLLLFIIITFLQSGMDKILDWKGNLSWLKGHFSKTPLKNMVPLLLGIVLLVEVVAGILCGVGLIEFIAKGHSHYAVFGASLACIALLMLLFGQRVAKDYDGARTIAIYFIPAIFLVWILVK